MIGRALASLAAAVLALVVFQAIPVPLVPIAWVRVALLLAQIVAPFAAAVYAWKRFPIAGWKEIGLAALGAVIIGVIGFQAGYHTLGEPWAVVVTGPLGILVGAVAGVMYARVRRTT